MTRLFIFFYLSIHATPLFSDPHPVTWSTVKHVTQGAAKSAYPNPSIPLTLDQRLNQENPFYVYRPPTLDQRIDGYANGVSKNGRDGVWSLSVREPVHDVEVLTILIELLNKRWEPRLGPPMDRRDMILVDFDRLAVRWGLRPARHLDGVLLIHLVDQIVRGSL